MWRRSNLEKKGQKKEFHLNINKLQTQKSPPERWASSKIWWVRANSNRRPLPCQDRIEIILFHFIFIRLRIIPHVFYHSKKREFAKYAHLKINHLRK
ncbi:hypothetical protein CGG79_03530 [Vibrio parahaemolyticus]|nr:hypothetical protein CA162_07215 [Vibrio parahaemolyticus]TOQ46899.1 hypothetical protein CGG95_03040 [Vibrio parahaemolyticus]TOR34763.1 hypothetical protein CGG79_03530 [Vibrio parahaemolyticus]